MDNVEITRRQFLKAAFTTAVTSLAGAVGLKALDDAVKHVPPEAVIDPDTLIDKYDVIIHKRGNTAIAIDCNKRTPIGKSTYHGSLIQEAINYLVDRYGYGAIALGSGGFEVDKTIKIPPRVNIVGNGKTVTVLKAADGLNSTIIETIEDKVHWWCPYIAHFEIYGNWKYNEKGHGIRIISTQHAIIYDVGLHDIPEHAILIETTTKITTLGVKLHNINIVRVGKVCIRIKRAHDISIVTCGIGECWRGIVASSTGSLSIIDTAVWNCESMGIYVYLGSSIYISGMRGGGVSLCRGGGINLYDVNGGIIMGVRTFKNGPYGITLSGKTKHVIVMGCIVHDNKYGIKEVEEADYNMIVNNILYRNEVHISKRGINTIVNGNLTL